MQLVLRCFDGATLSLAQHDIYWLDSPFNKITVR